MKRTYIGIDLGTSGTKFLLVAANGEILAENTQSSAQRLERAKP